MPTPCTARSTRRRLLFAFAAWGCAPAARAATTEGAQDNAAIERLHAEQRAGVCSARTPAGIGLRGEYFAREALAGQPLIVRTDATVDFETSLDWPDDKRSQLPRSARWTGWIKPPLSGRYRLHAGAPGAVVFVSNQALTMADAVIELAAGRFYPVRIEVPQLVAARPQVRFEWTAPHGARYVVPRALLYLPSETAR